MAAQPDSCNTVYHETQSSIGECSMPDQGNEIRHGEGVVSDTAPGADWLSELIGQTAANRLIQ